MRIEGSNRRLSLHWTSLAEGNANFSIVIVFRYSEASAGESAPVTVILNWAAGLKK
jgi:hypothetical protein